MRFEYFIFDRKCFLEAQSIFGGVITSTSFMCNFTFTSIRCPSREDGATFYLIPAPPQPNHFSKAVSHPLVSLVTPPPWATTGGGDLQIVTCHKSGFCAMGGMYICHMIVCEHPTPADPPIGSLCRCAEHGMRRSDAERSFGRLPS